MKIIAEVGKLVEKEIRGRIGRTRSTSKIVGHSYQ